MRNIISKKCTTLEWSEQFYKTGESFHYFHFGIKYELRTKNVRKSQKNNEKVQFSLASYIMKLQRQYAMVSPYVANGHCKIKIVF